MGGQLVLSVPGVAHRLGVRTVAVVPRVHRHHLQHVSSGLLLRGVTLLVTPEYYLTLRPVNLCICFAKLVQLDLCKAFM